MKKYKYKIIQSNDNEYLFTSKNKAKNYIKKEKKIYAYREYLLERIK